MAPGLSLPVRTSLCLAAAGERSREVGVFLSRFSVAVEFRLPADHRGLLVLFSAELGAVRAIPLGLDRADDAT